MKFNPGDIVEVTVDDPYLALLKKGDKVKLLTVTDFEDGVTEWNVEDLSTKRTWYLLDNVLELVK